MTDQATSDAAFDPTDPHGFHSADTHGHVVLSMRVLVGVVVALLFFTALTVFASRFEVWAAQAFEIEIPQSVNVVIAMSIAVAKGLLVALFFMQLRYDSPLNSIIICICLLTFGSFIGFTALDLFSRDAVDRVREGEIQAGGSGGFGYRPEEYFDEQTGQWEFGRVVLAGDSIATHARTRVRSIHPIHHEEEAVVSSPDLSIPILGLYLFAPNNNADNHGEQSHEDRSPTGNPGTDSAGDEGESSDGGH